MSGITIIKDKIKRGLALTQQESWDIYKYIEALEQQPNRCDNCIHSEEQDGSNCYECVKGMADNFEAQSTDTDCISRAYIEPIVEELENICINGDEHVLSLLSNIKNAPSVTPSYNSIKTELDCISRQAVDELSKELVHITRDKGDFLCNFWEELRKLPPVTPRTNLAETSQDVIDKIKEEILNEAEYAYADFDKYKEDILYAEPDELPDDDFRYGLERAVEIINKYKLKSEDLHLPPLYQIGFQDGYMRAIYDNNKGEN